MKLICSQCGHESTDGHLWCERIDCPAGNVPATLTFGEYLGDIQIIRLLRGFRTAAIYEGKRADTPVLLKVAHAAHQATLKREGQILSELAGHNVPSLPELLPPYEGADIQRMPYGKAVFRGETQYYLLFRHRRGVFLRDLLYENPEPWYQHAAWITISVSRAISHLHAHGRVLHLGLNPDVVLVTFEDKTRIPHTLLLDMGLMLGSSEVSNPRRQTYEQIMQHVPPSYVAPELVKHAAIGNFTDVYGVGLLLYEMMAGRPAYSHKLRSASEVHDTIRSQKERPPRLNRRDVPRPEKVEEIFTQSLHTNVSYRYEGVTALRNDLLEVFGDVPNPEKPAYRNPQVILSAALAIGSAAGVIFLLAVLIAAFID